MAESKSDFTVGGLPLNAPHVIYADQIAQVGLGPYVTKLTFGTGDVQGQLPAPIVTIVMPTTAVLTMCQHIVQVLQIDDTNKNIVAEVERYLVALKGQS